MVGSMDYLKWGSCFKIRRIRLDGRGHQILILKINSSNLLCGTNCGVTYAPVEELVDSQVLGTCPK